MDMTLSRNEILERVERNARDNRIACQTAEKCGKKLVSVSEAAHLYKLIETLAKGLKT